MIRNFVLAGMFCFVGCATEESLLDDRHSVERSEGFVADSATAIKIAEAVLMPIYGKETIQKEKPFKANLKDGVWIIEGTLSKNKTGGVAIIEISKVDGRILRVSHGK